MNKVDFVDDEEMFEFVEMEVCELFDQYEFDGDNVFIIQGFVLKVFEGDVDVCQKIFDLMVVVDLDIFELECVIDKDFLMFIEDVFFIIGCGIVVIGCIECGVINIGDFVEIIGMMVDDVKLLIFIIIGVEMFCKILICGEVGDNVGLLLCGIDKNDIKCGMVICKLGFVKFYKYFKCEVYVLSKEEGGCYMLFFNGYCLQFYFCIIDVIGDVNLLDGVEMVMFGDNVLFEVKLLNIIVMEKGLCFVICEGGCIVGVGQVIEIID